MVSTIDLTGSWTEEGENIGNAGSRHEASCQQRRYTDRPGFKRVLSGTLFGLAFVGPTAPYSMFGIGTVKSRLLPVYAIAMVAMSLTAISYGRMASVGRRFDLRIRVQGAAPHAGYFAM
jgi:hypothetical protein